MHDLRRDWQRWTRAERLSLVVIVAAMVTVVVPAAVEFTYLTAAVAVPHHQALTPAR